MGALPPTGRRAFVALVAAALGIAGASLAEPVLHALEPSTVAPHRPATLELLGRGFEPGMDVMIETARAGRFLAYTPAELSDARCVVRLPLGFGPKPSQRAVYLRGADGGESTRLDLRIGIADEGSGTEPDGSEEPKEPEPEEPEETEPEETEPEVIADGPSVSGLWPTPLPALEAARIEVLGHGFEPGAEVWIQANVHAGSTRLPSFDMRPFPTTWIDGESLEVTLERGFFPAPASRRLVVVLPDGRRSPETFLIVAPLDLPKE